MTRRTALIVGGSRGIGLAIANAFAAHGYDLLLVARDAGKLEAAAASIRGKGQTQVDVLALDATEAAAPALIAAALAAANAELQFAVLGVGHWDIGAIDQLAPDALERVIRVNVVAPHALQKAIMERLAPDGGILFIGSLAGCMPLPWIAAYSAAKAHLHASVMALRQEAHGSGIKVCLLAPGAVRTDFIPLAPGQRWRWLLELFASSPETVAHAAFRGLASDVPVIVPGLFWRFAWLGMRLLPASLLSSISRLALRPLRPTGAPATTAPSLPSARC